MQRILSELKPNAEKVVFTNLLQVAAIILILVIIIFFLNIFVDISFLVSAVKEVSPGAAEQPFNLRSMAVPGAIIILFIMGIFLSLNYATYKKTKYLLEESGLRFYQNFLSIPLGELYVPYSNMVKVTFDKIPLLNTGNIAIELTGMEQKSVTLSFVDNPAEVASGMLKLINASRAKYCFQKSEEYKYGQPLR